MHTLLHGTHRFQGGRTACVTRSIVVVSNLQRIVLHYFFQRRIVAQVGIGPFRGIAMCIGHQHDPRAIHTLPQSEVERHLPSILIERFFTPLQLLCRKPYQS